MKRLQLWLVGRTWPVKWFVGELKWWLRNSQAGTACGELVSVHGSNLRCWYWKGLIPLGNPRSVWFFGRRRLPAWRRGFTAILTEAAFLVFLHLSWHTRISRVLCSSRSRTLVSYWCRDSWSCKFILRNILFGLVCVIFNRIIGSCSMVLIPTASDILQAWFEWNSSSIRVVLNPVEGRLLYGMAILVPRSAAALCMLGRNNRTHAKEWCLALQAICTAHCYIITCGSTTSFKSSWEGVKSRKKR